MEIRISSRLIRIDCVAIEEGFQLHIYPASAGHPRGCIGTHSISRKPSFRLELVQIAKKPKFDDRVKVGDFSDIS